VKGKYGFLTLLGVLALLTYFALITDRLPGDLAIVLWVQGLADPEKLGPIPNLLFWMGVMGVAGAVIVAACGWLWFKGHRTEAVFLALVGIPDLINVPLRDLIGRPRPTIELVQVFGGPQGASFPSGYTLHVLLFCGFILYLSRYLVKSRASRYILWAVLGLYIPVTGIWLILDGRHWPSDVLGGYVYGAFYLVLLIWGYKKYIAWRRRYGAHELPVRSRPLVWVLKLVE
jgi:undecaprenyl-diphosphatase